VEDAETQQKIETRAREIADGMLLEQERERERQDLIARVADLEGAIAGMAEANQKLAASVGSVEQGQLSPQARAKVVTYSTGGGVVVSVIVQVLRLLIGF